MFYQYVLVISNFSSNLIITHSYIHSSILGGVYLIVWPPDEEAEEEEVISQKSPVDEPAIALLHSFVVHDGFSDIITKTKGITAADRENLLIVWRHLYPVVKDFWGTELPQKLRKLPPVVQ